MASALLGGGPLITHRRGVRVDCNREEDGPDGQGSDPRRGSEVERPTTTTGPNRRPGSGSGGLLLGATVLLAAAVVVSSVTPVAAQYYNYPHAQVRRSNIFFGELGVTARVRSGCFFFVLDACFCARASVHLMLPRAHVVRPIWVEHF